MDVTSSVESLSLCLVCSLENVARGDAALSDVGDGNNAHFRLSKNKRRPCVRLCLNRVQKTLQVPCVPSVRTHTVKRGDDHQAFTCKILQALSCSEFRLLNSAFGGSLLQLFQHASTI